MSRFALLRAGYGFLQLASMSLFRGKGQKTVRRTVRVLGLRQLVQAAVTGPSPSPEVVALGAEVDLLHAASMIALASGRGRYRRVAAGEALAATALACGGLIAVGQARSAPQAKAGHRLIARRDRCARTLARYLVPNAWVRVAARTPFGVSRV